MRKNDKDNIIRILEYAAKKPRTKEEIEKVIVANKP